MKTMALSLALSLLGGAVALAAAGNPSATATVCTSVKERTPEGAATTFATAVGQLYCFSEVTNGEPKVAHVWYHGDKEVFRIELPVHGTRWRTWSAKKIPASMTGAWHVEVVDSAGKVLATAAFAVQ
jgi:hypothetical protein